MVFLFQPTVFRSSLTACSAAACTACKEVTVDVAVLGGGASGSYVAAQLADVYGKAVVVVDTASRLGGHVNTVKPPGSDHPIDFGVVRYQNLSFVAPFFNRYGINITAATGTAVTSVYLDQTTAEPVNVTQYSAEEQQAALGRWLDFGLKYKQYVYPSYNLPSPLGEAAPLARPFIETIKELNLESIVVELLDAHWSNDLLALPTLHAVSTFGYAWFDGTALVVPQSMNNSELYANIQAHLGDRVLLNSSVQSVRRSGNNGTSSLTVKGPQGCTHIAAKQIVVGFVPTTANIAPFDVSEEEQSLFEKFSCVNLHNGLIHVQGMPNGTDFDPLSSDPERLFVPTTPAVRISNMAGTPYSAVYVTGDPGTDDQAAKELIEQRLQAINEVDGYHLGTEPEYFGFADHTPIVCSVSPADMTAGFWTNLTALQGQMSTSYVGQAFAADLTAYVWAQAQEVIDRIVKEL